MLCLRNCVLAQIFNGPFNYFCNLSLKSNKMYLLMCFKMQNPLSTNTDNCGRQLSYKYDWHYFCFYKNVCQMKLSLINQLYVLRKKEVLKLKNITFPRYKMFYLYNTLIEMKIGKSMQYHFNKNNMLLSFFHACYRSSDMNEKSLLNCWK